VPDAPHRSPHRLEVLRAVAEHLNREVTLQPMLEGALALILQLLHLNAGWIVLLDDEGRFVSAAAHGLPPALASDDRAALRWTPCRCQRMLLSGELSGPANIVDCERLERIHQALAGASAEVVAEQAGNLHVHASVPLRAGDRVLGLLNLARAGREPLDQETVAARPGGGYAGGGHRAGPAPCAGGGGPAGGVPGRHSSRAGPAGAHLAGGDRGGDLRRSAGAPPA